MSQKLLLEIACFSLESALTAQAAGADRIELCEDYAVGGVTPPETLIQKARAALNIPLHVMIRPRGGDFIYSADEIQRMRDDILICKRLGIDGVVFGCLHSTKEIDVQYSLLLTELARPMSVTFHRAVDVCADKKKAFGDLVRLGIDRVLTSGGSASAEKGLQELTILQKLFGKSIHILPGGGIRSSNIIQLLASGCYEYHSSGIVSGTEANGEEIAALKHLLTKAANL